MLDEILEEFPKPLQLKQGLTCQVRPLQADDEPAFYEFFQSVPPEERMFIKHRVSDPAVIHTWCQELDYGRNLPLLAVRDHRILAVCTLHQQLGGWKRHIGRISVLVHPEFRAIGLARALVTEMIEVARGAGLEKLEAEFIASQQRAIHVFSLLGFRQLLRLPEYVRDMQAVSHDYILMGIDLETDEEYAGME